MNNIEPFDQNSNADHGLPQTIQNVHLTPFTDDMICSLLVEIGTNLHEKDRNGNHVHFGDAGNGGIAILRLSNPMGDAHWHLLTDRDEHYLLDTPRPDDCPEFVELRFYGGCEGLALAKALRRASFYLEEKLFE